MFADAADLYVSIGFKVFPLGHGLKLPAIKGGKGVHDASDDPDMIDAWAKKFPKANIGIACGEVSGIVVIDVDPRNGGTKTLNDLAAKGYVFPRCPEAKTGNGGRHLFFQIPHGDLRKTLGEGVDIKGNGGYVVGAPSWIAPSDAGPGGTYTWVIHPESCDVPQLPAWAVAKIVKPVPQAPKFEARDASGLAEKSVEGMARRVATAGKGNRNNILNWAAYKAGQLAREGKIGMNTVEARLTMAGLAAGLSLPEVKATLTSGLRGVKEA
jgi:hypothetical protein